MSTILVIATSTTTCIYNEKYFSDDHFSYYYSLCHYMRAWIRILDAPSCTAWAERKSALQGSCKIGQNCRAMCTKLSMHPAANSRVQCNTNTLRLAPQFCAFP